MVSWGIPFLLALKFLEGLDAWASINVFLLGFALGESTTFSLANLTIREERLI